jgi:hypothetical protein
VPDRLAFSGVGAAVVKVVANKNTNTLYKYIFMYMYESNE